MRKRGLFRRLGRTLLKIILYGFLLSVLYILFCKWINPPITITQLNSLITGHGLRRDYIDYTNMGSNIKLAVMAGEDQLFPDHNGFDFKSIQKALKHNRKSKSLRGASTISQQVAKNVFLWQHGGYFRKGLEVYFTFMIEQLWSKKRILEMYLNVAQTGPGIYGVQAAAKYYFKEDCNDLSPKEAAMIASCLPNPVLFTIHPMSRRVAYRYPWILRQMKNLQADADIQALLK
ncbi:monofunctional biosynthetic peptidoglycan transglycosylase [Hanamia caeni]|uniref:Biosynthetic peptidoglycan transglycosylase n=1 Tax=Hanamia caeni TaxID=2294116 RepID=A0A3M9NBJ8_9BACT|nr:monofunctional biosynthetic peptidoglycan transglycosylase [Hanamia caeni]